MERSPRKKMGLMLKSLWQRFLKSRETMRKQRLSGAKCFQNLCYTKLGKGVLRRIVGYRIRSNSQGFAVRLIKYIRQIHTIIPTTILRWLLVEVLIQDLNFLKKKRVRQGQNSDKMEAFRCMLRPFPLIGRRFIFKSGAFENNSLINGSEQLSLVPTKKRLNCRSPQSLW